MAKLHSRKRGKSKSKKPKVREKTQNKYSDEEIKQKIIELVKKGTRPSEIGLILRDEYGVGDLRVVLGMRLMEFLAEEKALQAYPQDLIDLIRKAVRVRNHMKDNKQDKHNGVKLTHIESKIHRLVKYYKKEKVLSGDWKYDYKTAPLLLK